MSQVPAIIIGVAFCAWFVKLLLGDQIRDMYQYAVNMPAEHFSRVIVMVLVLAFVIWLLK